MSEDGCFKHCIITGNRCEKDINCIECEVAIQYFGGRADDCKAL